MRNGRFVVLLIEDDRKLLKTMTQFLESRKYTVMQAETGKQALEQFFSLNHQIDIVLLDVMLPEIDGYEVLRRIREYSSVPVIMTTSRDAEEDQLQGLRDGADNYITKPFRLSILSAHMENLLKRSNKAKELTFGKLAVNVENRQVRMNGTPISLTPREFDLLHYFIQQCNRVLSREMILDSVWGFDYDGDNRTVDTLVKQLRKKLTEECPYIHSVYGIGYCFKEE